MLIRGNDALGESQSRGGSPSYPDSKCDEKGTSRTPFCIHDKYLEEKLETIDDILNSSNPKFLPSNLYQGEIDGYVYKDSLGGSSGYHRIDG